jgi:hypothetical protein
LNPCNGRALSSSVVADPAFSRASAANVSQNADAVVLLGLWIAARDSENGMYNM